MTDKPTQTEFPPIKKSLAQEIIEAYEDKKGPIHFTGKANIKMTLKALGLSRLKELQKLKMLDLGCGSDLTTDGTMRDNSFSPTLCRVFHKLGIEITGVNILPPSLDTEGNPQTEEWPFVQLDLRFQNALGVFEDNSHDVITTTNFIAHGQECATSPTLERQCTDTQQLKNIEDEIFDQALRILKPGGIFIVNRTSVYKKVQIGDQPYFEFKKISEKGQDNLPYIVSHPISEAPQTPDLP